MLTFQTTQGGIGLPRPRGSLTVQNTLFTGRRMAFSLPDLQRHRATSAPEQARGLSPQRQGETGTSPTLRPKGPAGLLGICLPLL